MLRWCVRREVVWTVGFAGHGLIIRSVLFGRLLGCMFVVHWFALLYCWVIRSVVFVEAGLRAASASPFWLFVGRIILCRVPLFLVIASFWGVHHLYIMGWGGLPVLGRRWFLVVSGIVVHTVDVFGVVI